LIAAAIITHYFHYAALRRHYAIIFANYAADIAHYARLAAGCCAIISPMMPLMARHYATLPPSAAIAAAAD